MFLQGKTFYSLSTVGHWAAFSARSFENHCFYFFPFCVALCNFKYLSVTSSTDGESVGNLLQVNG